MTLANPSVFACYCHSDINLIQVGILVLGENFIEGWHTLFNLQDELTSYRVYISYSTANPSYNVTLYGDPIQNS